MENFYLFHVPLFYYFFLLALIMGRIPVVGRFFKIINTAVHELGHTIMSLLLSGKVQKIELLSNSEGVTVSQTSHPFKSFLVSLAGYPFASVVSYLSFWVFAKGFYQELIIGFMAIFLIMLIFWIRNWYGLFWVLLFAGLNFALLYFYKEQPIVSIIALFYTVILFTESLFSSFYVSYRSISTPKDAGDCTNLKNASHIPAVFWGILFALFSLFVTYRIVMNFTAFFVIQVN
ncbi:MAG: M50 family metallopeptidase [Bacteroidales bacterium]|jgi:hypothetical protein|nr:M50 family metallopeptidase [Bacteroidales bacterium]